MSATNYFILKKKENDLVFGLEDYSHDLVELARKRDIGIHFGWQYYVSEVKSLCKDDNYFFISDSFSNAETDNLFSQVDVFEGIKHLHPKQGKIKERELLLFKYNFLNEIVEILFKQPNIEYVDFYVSTGQAILSDYEICEVKDRNLTKAFIDALNPTKQDNYFGLKTIKYEIK